MRIVLVSLVAVAALFAVVAAAYACPQGYAPCGPRYCCPR